MKVTINKYLKEGIIFVVMIALGMNAISYYRSLDLTSDRLKIESFRLLDDTQYTVSKDKPLLIHFWAIWCPTCKFEASNIDRISIDYEVITIAIQSGSKKDIQAYLDNNNLSFNVVNDKGGYYSKKFNIQFFPTTLMYDKNKNLKFSEVGYTSTVGLYSRMIYISNENTIKDKM